MFEQELENLKIKELNKMQLACIEASKQKEDILLLSPTGSGKTLAFLLPIVNAINPELKKVQAIIIVPARELAIQIEQVFKSMNTGHKVSVVYGGHSTKVEINNLTEAPAVLIGTPGRMAHHIDNTNIDTSHVLFLVLDEFDKSLELGFKAEMAFIIPKVKRSAKRILTSATNMKEIPPFTGVKNPIILNYLEESAPVISSLDVKFLQSNNTDKLDILYSLICKLGNEVSLIFCNHKDAVDRISNVLTIKDIAHGVFHGGLDQDERTKTLIKFRNGSYHILVATDLASRGLDIPEIKNVIHYQLPNTLDVYIHRNGRTARMNADGTAYLLLATDDYLPKFISDKPKREILPEKNNLPPKVKWATLYISAGKKDKINKMDIVGMLLQKGKLEKHELGLVDVLDKSSFAAVRTNKINKTLELIKEEKIKNKKVKVEISR